MGLFSVQKKNNNHNGNYMNASGIYLNQKNNYMNGQGAFPSQLYNQNNGNYNQPNNGNLTNFNNGNNVYRPTNMNDGNNMQSNMQNNNMQNNMQDVHVSPKRSYVVTPSNQNQPVNNVNQPNFQSLPSNNGSLTEKLDNNLDTLDPLNNGINPTPVNPVAPREQVDTVARDSKTSLFEALGIILGIVLHPCNTVIDNTKKYKYNDKAFTMFLYFNVIALILCLASRILFGGFVRTFNSYVGTYSNHFVLSNLFTLQNYLVPLIGCLCVTAVFTLLVSLVYYVFSFINSKGVTFGTYLMIAEQSIFPFFAGIFFVFPLAKFISSTLAFVLVILTFLYTFLIFVYSISDILTFKNNDSKIFYNSLNMLIIGFILFLGVSAYMRINSYDLAYLISFIS